MIVAGSSPVISLSLPFTSTVSDRTWLEAVTPGAAASLSPPAAWYGRVSLASTM